MRKHIGKFAEFRHEIGHDEEADLVAYQHRAGNGHWRTISAWIIPQAQYR